MAIEPAGLTGKVLVVVRAVLRTMSDAASIERSRFSPSRTAVGMLVTTKSVMDPSAGMDALAGAEKRRYPPEALLCFMRESLTASNAPLPVSR